MEEDNNTSSKEKSIEKINQIRDTLRCLEESLKDSRNAEAEQCLRFSNERMKSQILAEDLKRADRRNKNMLNLFRQSVTDPRLEIQASLPTSLRREVQRTWHQKYDALLARNEELRRELGASNSNVQEKVKKIEDLEQRVLNLAEKLVERDEATENLCRKYLNLKKRKDEQEIHFRSTIEVLQRALDKANSK